MRRYLLTFEAHMPPTVQDEQPAVVLDELLILHGRVNQRLAEKQEAANPA